MDIIIKNILIFINISMISLILSLFLKINDINKQNKKFFKYANNRLSIF